jgi:hypothetical protein
MEVAPMAQPGDLTIKLASEVKGDATISLKCQDFGTFEDDGAVEASLLAAVYTIAQGRDVYVGCMGGIGRTGTWMAIMAGLLQPGIRDTIKFIRKNYRSGAVERDEQATYVKNFLRTHRPLGVLCRSILDLPKPVVKPKARFIKVKKTPELVKAVQSTAQEQHRSRGALGG